jgi:membrane protease YdiL (CAAX protease family)
MSEVKFVDVTTGQRAWAIDWPLIFFFGIGYLIAWGLVPVLALIARQSGLEDWTRLHDMGEAFNFEGAVLSVPGWVVYLITRVQDFAFTIAGLVMIAVLHGRAGLRDLGRRLRCWNIQWYWYLVAFLPFGLYLLATLIVGAMPSFQFNAGLLWATLFSLESGFFIKLFLRGAMGEELGLRGFALARLQTYTTPFKASLIISLLWGPWHLPVLVRRNLLGIIIFILAVIALSFIFTWLFNNTQGSLIPVLLFHAAQNSAGIFELYFPALIKSNWELISVMGLLTSGIVFGWLLWRKDRARKAIS